MTVQDLLTAAIRSIGVVASEETPSASELTDALFSANQILDSWSPEILPVLPLTRDFFPLSGTASYTWGTSGVWTTARPVKIESVAVVASNGARKEARQVPVEEWAGIVDTTATGLFADVWFSDHGYPLTTVYLLPKPAGGNAEIQSYKPLTAFVNLTDTVALAPGYTKALRWCLAVEMAPEFGRPVTQEMMALLQSSKQAITQLNAAVLGRPNTVEPPAPVAAPQAAA